MKRILLDTNALSDILSGMTNFAKFSKLVGKEFLKSWVYAASSYSVVEIYNGSEDRWHKFIDFVSERDFIVFLPEWIILEYEYIKYRNPSANENEPFFRLNFRGENSIEMFTSMIDEFSRSQNERTKEAAAIIDLGKRNNRESAKYKESSLIPQLLKVNGIELDSPEDYIKFPSMRVHGFTIVRRMKNSKRKPVGSNDIMDSLISYCIPYVDVIITDKEQCEILGQAKREIKDLNNLEIYPLSSFANL